MKLSCEPNSHGVNLVIAEVNYESMTKWEYDFVIN